MPKPDTETSLQALPALSAKDTADVMGGSISTMLPKVPGFVVNGRLFLFVKDTTQAELDFMGWGLRTSSVFTDLQESLNTGFSYGC